MSADLTKGHGFTRGENGRTRTALQLLTEAAPRPPDQSEIVNLQFQILSRVLQPRIYADR